MGRAALRSVGHSEDADLSKTRFGGGDGGVIPAEVIASHYLGRTVYSTEEAEDAVHYTKGLTFTVPNTAECRVRQMELIGNFAEALGQTGEWSTVFEMHPRFSYVGGYMRESR